MGVNSLPKTVTRQRRCCDLNPGPSAPESSTLATRLPSHLRVTCGYYRTLIGNPMAEVEPAGHRFYICPSNSKVA